MSFEPPIFIQNEINHELEEIGKQLSIITDCPIHYCPHGKPGFRCKHDVFFPLFALKPAYETGKWYDVYRKHEDEKGWCND